MSFVFIGDVHNIFLSAEGRMCRHYQDILCISGHNVNLMFAGSLFYTTTPQGEMCMMSQSASSAAALLGHVTHVPIKEGLHSVIKCLKNQDLAFSPRECVFYL